MDRFSHGRKPNLHHGSGISREGSILYTGVRDVRRPQERSARGDDYLLCLSCKSISHERTNTA